MKQECLRAGGALILILACFSAGANTSLAQGKAASGELAGVVRDSTGTPQMGATVEIVPETASKAASLGLLTNTQGIFHDERLTPGLYTVRVTLAGFLPTVQQHVRISAHLTTIVRVELESMFASLDQLRKQPSTASVESDDWKWILRSASVTRPVLQWTDDGSVSASNDSSGSDAHRPRARLDFTDGARHAGSASNLPSAPSTAFAYDQELGGSGRLLLAGQANYDSDVAGGGIATVWLPTGSFAAGPHSALVLRESRIGPDGPTFRGVRMEQGGALPLGDRALLRYGAEYVLVGMVKSATSLRPRLELDTSITEAWHAAMIFAEEPGVVAPLDSDEREMGSELAATLNELDSFPTLLWHDGRPVLEAGWHEEIAASRKLGSGELQVAAFHDDNRHVAVFGRGNDLPAADYFQEYSSNAFAYDGGASGNWGMRIAVRQKVSDSTELTAVYAYAGALSPSDLAVPGPTRNMLHNAMYNSVAGSVSTKFPRFGTKVNVGYKWVGGDAVSRVDAFGESLFQIDPFLHVGVRQALPKFAPGRWEAIANCDNLFAQGYVSVNSQDGHALLIPAFRTFRGGLSVQF